jgi:hypothetical protein
VLPSAGRIRGRVVDARDAPVAGAWVGEEHAAFTVKFGGPRDHATDSVGHFDIEVQSTHLRLVAIANGHAPSEALVVDVEPGRTLENLEFHLRDAYRVQGRVLEGAPWTLRSSCAPDSVRAHHAEINARHRRAEGSFGRTQLIAWRRNEPALASARSRSCRAAASSSRPGSDQNAPARRIIHQALRPMLAFWSHSRLQTVP